MNMLRLCNMKEYKIMQANINNDRDMFNPALSAVPSVSSRGQFVWISGNMAVTYDVTLTSHPRVALSDTYLR